MLAEICKYMDSFGTKYTFYTDGKPRFYTILGGILTIVSYLLSLSVLIYFSIDGFKCLTSTTFFINIFSGEHPKIKFNEEKIWIPWRIVDYNNNFVNHTNLIYPMIYYYEGERKTTNDHFELKSKLIDYKLCNETSMINKPENYFFGAPLDKLYCIDMDDLEIGGAWIGLYINYIEMNFYLCEDGINYNENNIKCTTSEKIYKNIGKNNSLKIEFYYPNVKFQPTNKNNPMIIFYNQYYYHVSKFSNKIDRLFLQEHILSDDKGWLHKKIINSSYWGYSGFEGDSYFTSDKEDLINKGSTSRFYSLSLYMEHSVMNYNRSYKKLLPILTECLPIVYIVLKIFRKIAKFFKLAEQKRKTVELLFENLKEKKNKFTSVKKEIISIDNSYNINIYANQQNNNNISSNFIINCKNGKNTPKNGKLQSISINKSNLEENLNNDFNKESFINSIEYINAKNISKMKFLNIDANNNIGKYSPKINNNSSKNICNILHAANDIKYVKEKLFNYKYYFGAVFIKSVDITKYNLCFSKKFIKVYTFINQMFDISSYLILMREFELIKNIYIKKGKNNIFGKSKKINVNSRIFSRNMNECIDNKNFDIFAKNI